MTEFKKKALDTLDEIFNLVESKFDNFEVDYEDENLKKNLLLIPISYLQDPMVRNLSSIS